MQNAECRIVVSLGNKNEIIAGGDTFILHFEFCILHYNGDHVTVNMQSI